MAFHLRYLVEPAAKAGSSSDRLRNTACPGLRLLPLRIELPAGLCPGGLWLACLRAGDPVGFPALSYPAICCYDA
jgi:hypothetical protein